MNPIYKTNTPSFTAEFDSTLKTSYSNDVTVQAVSKKSLRAHKLSSYYNGDFETENPKKKYRRKEENPSFSTLYFKQNPQKEDNTSTSSFEHPAASYREILTCLVQKTDQIPENPFKKEDQEVLLTLLKSNGLDKTNLINELEKLYWDEFCPNAIRKESLPDLKEEGLILFLGLLGGSSEHISKVMCEINTQGHEKQIPEQMIYDRPFLYRPISQIEEIRKKGVGEQFKSFVLEYLEKQTLDAFEDLPRKENLLISDDLDEALEYVLELDLKNLTPFHPQTPILDLFLEEDLEKASFKRVFSFNKHL